MGKGLELPYSDLTAGRTPGVTAIFDAKRRIAGLPVGGFGPRDPLGSQEHGKRRGPTHNPNLSGFILTCYFVLSLSSPPAEAQRAPTCSPPRGVAANCATLRVAEAISHSPPHSAKFVLGAPPTRRYSVALAEDGDSSRNRANRSRPKAHPVLRPVSASLRLRFRFAAFSRACAIQLYSVITEIVESLL